MSVDYALDQYFSVTLSDDKIVAYIQLTNWEKDFACTVEALEQFLRSHQVRYGLQHDILQRIAKHAEEYQYSKTPIAMGTEPVHGHNGKIQFTVDFGNEANLKPLEIEDGKVDYKEVIRLNNVKKGQLIATRIPPTKGVPGTAVTGEEIPSKPGKEAHFKVGKNVVVNAENSAMYAALDGLLTKTEKGKINVFPVYEINGDVDYSTGNIDFVGTVVIRGNVLTGFRIKAAGDIRVTGFVEGAELDAGGSIDISGGIIGYNKGHVQAGQDVKSSFIQDGNVIAGASVFVSQSIMHSNIRAAQNIECNGTKGLVVGGILQAGEKVVARTIGNSMSTATVIEVGVLPELRNELADLRAQLKLSVESMDKTDKALYLLNQLASSGQLSTDKLALRVKLNATKKSNMAEQSDLKDRMLEIEKMLEDTGKARVNVVKTIYGGAKIVIGRYTRYIKDPTQRVSFYYHEGDITMVPLL
ncbi:polymerase [Bacillus sp. FJAT-18019]|uniref:Polymerase n=1 Tax=Paenibacillus solani TaxID=1705565 RepID=A0A0M1P7H1_9BACL|nr:FapA family protein [Paenibacillus solani]KOP67661.1 polymerase [Bacillus sp. FJAT-18019]KOR89984.1 polymerase [Paenibacillus solani]